MNNQIINIEHVLWVRASNEDIHVKVIVLIKVSNIKMFHTKKVVVKMVNNVEIVGKVRISILIDFNEKIV